MARNIQKRFIPCYDPRISTSLVCDLNRTPIVMAKHGGSCVHFSGISTWGRTSRETVWHPQCPPLPSLCKISLPIYVIVTNELLQPLSFVHCSWKCQLAEVHQADSRKSQFIHTKARLGGMWEKLCYSNTKLSTPEHCYHEVDSLIRTFLDYVHASATDFRARGTNVLITLKNKQLRNMPL